MKLVMHMLISSIKVFKIYRLEERQPKSLSNNLAAVWMTSLSRKQFQTSPIDNSRVSPFPAGVATAVVRDKHRNE